LTDISTIIYTSTQIDLTTTLPVITCCAPLATASLSDEEAHATATLFRALSDPARVKIVNLLARSDEPVCVCEFVPAVELSQPTVSHHLKKLTEAGLLEREERGKWAYYSLSGEAVERLAALVEFKEAVR
jgi:ArsR family transcriptional regulator